MSEFFFGSESDDKFLRDITIASQSSGDVSNEDFTLFVKKSMVKFGATSADVCRKTGVSQGSYGKIAKRWAEGTGLPAQPIRRKVLESLAPIVNKNACSPK